MSPLSWHLHPFCADPRHHSSSTCMMVG
jgi:hypothetical protein